jgi:hypothetical protein
MTKQFTVLLLVFFLATCTFRQNLFSWRIDTDKPPGFEQVHESSRSYLRLLRPGGAHLDRSVLKSFRMEFDLRIEEPIEDPFAYAMINFKNFFGQRYVLLVEPTVIQLLASKGKHSQPRTLFKANVASEKGRWNRFEIINAQDNIRVFMNDRLIIDYKDRFDPIQLGNIWFESHSQYSFTNVEVYRLKDFVRIDMSTEEGAASETGSNRKEKVVIAVTDFENNGLMFHELSLIMGLFADSLCTTGAFKVLERKELLKDLREQEILLSSFEDSEKTVKIGQSLNISLLVTGSCERLGEEYVISLKVLSTKSGKPVSSVESRFNDPSEIPRHFDVFARELVTKLKL